MEGDVEAAKKKKEKEENKKPFWTHWRLLLHPEKLPSYIRKRQRERRKWLRQVSVVLDKVEEEEAFDWDDLDDDGNPMPNSFWCPRLVRRGSRFCLLVYIDPFLELLAFLPEIHVVAKWTLRFLPLVGFCLAFGWFSLAIYKNWQYKQGDCTVEKLPEAYDTIGMIIEEVEAVYIVRRYFQATPDRAKGSKIQECKATVSCGEMEYSRSESNEHARCVAFESWKLGDGIECYYHQDDYWGDDDRELFCLGLPSKLERETFTLGVSFLLLCLSCFITGVVSWRKNDLKHQSELAQKELQRQAREAAAAKKRQEDQEAADNKNRAKAMEAAEGITDADENLGEFNLDD
jgi:hypothetical protein